jgi:catalase (peroxidase I)
MNDEMFRLALIDMTNDDLLNDFVNDIFEYDFDLKKEEYVYIQYKVVGDNIILNIYDNKNSNRFKAYIFTLNDIDSNGNSRYINVKKEYDKYKNDNKDKLCLLSSLLFTKDDNEKIEIINSLFSGKIKDIFSHYFL